MAAKWVANVKSTPLAYRNGMDADVNPIYGRDGPRGDDANAIED
jgi:hypothetical protein